MAEIKVYERYPIIVEAVLYDGKPETTTLVQDWLTRKFPKSVFNQNDMVNTDRFVMLPTVEGPKVVNVGDFIVVGILGDIFPMAKEDFEAMFHLADIDQLEEMVQKGLIPDQMTTFIAS